jgi:hypothetical protein
MTMNRTNIDTAMKVAAMFVKERIPKSPDMRPRPMKRDAPI